MQFRSRFNFQISNTENTFELLNTFSLVVRIVIKRKHQLKIIVFLSFVFIFICSCRFIISPINNNANNILFKCVHNLWFNFVIDRFVVVAETASQFLITTTATANTINQPTTTTATTAATATNTSNIATAIVRSANPTNPQ